LSSIGLFIYLFMLQKRNANSPIHKQQIKFISTGILLYAALATIFNVLVPLFSSSWESSRFGPVFVLLLVGLVAFTIIKHKLFDIRLIVARSLGYILTIATLVGVYAFLIAIVSSRLFTGDSVSTGQTLLFVATTLVFGFSLPPLKRFFDKQTNRLFYRDAYDSQLLLDELNKILVGNIDIQPLLRQCSELFERTLKAELCTFIIRETDNTIRRSIGSGNTDIHSDEIIELIRAEKVRTQMVVSDEIEDTTSKLKSALVEDNISILARLAPAGKNAKVLGYLVLGNKKSGNPYNKQDLQVLEIIVNELVIAIQNALRFEEIQEFTVTLQEKVDDATKDLRKANDKLKALDETKDEFISMASHQLRTPLTSVKGYVSMVVEGDAGKITKQQKELLNQAFSSSQRMVYLIADLLNVSRLRTGKFVIENKPTQLADVIEGEMAQLKEVASGKNQTLTYDKPDKFPVLSLDETKIRQVIMNFTDNALHYTPNDGHINVKLEDLGKSIQFTVVDDGLGVPKNEQHHLFSKFYRAGNAKKARPDGTGLGLFMAKKVIIAQGGAIIFKSEENKGSTFGFTFPKEKVLAKTATKTEKKHN
ncbi:GAF domain-containing sensor histidine kinase, partial [Candidatus Saccharibacteria bacterium]|nr:GAF domain-containing sensor histidine kinase [Candidatus Saccharibacteria bacterium]